MGKTKKILKILLKPLSFVNGTIKKDSNCVFFYSNLGFRDNVRAMYDYMIDSGINEQKKITVATDEYKKYRKNAPENVRFVSLKSGIFAFFKAKYCFYSFGKYPIKPSKEQKVVNLWHGMPLKAIGRYEKGCENEDQNFFSHTIATSPFFAKIMAKAFGADEEQVILSAQPRCDVFFKENAKPEFLKGFEKVVFWLPTFMSSKRLGRTDGNYSELNPYNADFLKNLQSVLKENDTLLLIKPHPMDDAALSEEAFENIMSVTDEDLENMGHNLYDVLKFSNALVTDFSSIYIDFMLLDRPIAFAGADVEAYGENRGFTVENPKEYMPGENLKAAEDFIGFIQNLKKSIDPYKEKRQALCKIFHTTENPGCENILNKINF